MTRHSRPPALHPRTRAVALAIAALPGLALAQATPATAKTEKIEVTGSSIKRIEGESALPVQVITREEIEKGGSTTAAELITKISANSATLTDGASFSDIAGQRGFNGANLRGIGVSSTLILLNGRRMANFASPGGASGVDLNAIPTAAIERVEVLKDGASAIYGTDAIGGVINFITRRDFRGAQIYGYASRTQDGGADKSIATLSGGVGDLNNDRFNAFAVLDYQDTGTLRSTQRDWVKGSYQPDINLDVGSSNTYPANFRVLRPGSNSATGPRINPSAPGCNPPATRYFPESFVGSRACYYDYMQDTEIFPASKRLSLIGRAAAALSHSHTLFAEYTHSRTETLYRISALTVTNLNYPAAGRYYPSGIGVSGPLRLNWRLSEAGGRTNEVESTADRILLGAKGLFSGWEYDTALNRSVSRVTDAYVDGYVATTPFNAAVATGNINPFGPSDAAGLTLLRSTKIRDDARDSEGTTTSFDLKASRGLFAMAGGEAALALGAEVRRERMDFRASDLLRRGEIRGDGAAENFSGRRSVAAAFAELSLPFTTQVEAQLALRADRYDDVGNTTNPKLGVRWTPTREMLVRSAYGTGFRAPSLADLYTPTRIGQTNGVYNDPLGCIRVGNLNNTNNPDYCGIQPDKLRGGSKDLKPEKSRQFSLGVVLKPSRHFNAALDYFRIEKTDVITSPEGIYFANPTAYAAFITRAAADPALPGIPGRITQIDSRLRNIGGFKTDGFDIGLEVRSPTHSWGRLSASLNGTYVLHYKVQEGPGQPYTEGVGRFANDQVVQRWRHLLSIGFDRGPFSATLQQTFYRGYRDQQAMPDGSPRRVSDYELWDLTGSYTLSAIRLRAGVRNLLDKAPPRSNQLYSFLAGYDPNYTDPRGRSYFLSASYIFK
jgi:iron complex outermembrane receptor protein